MRPSCWLVVGLLLVDWVGGWKVLQEEGITCTYTERFSTSVSSYYLKCKQQKSKEGQDETNAKCVYGNGIDRNRKNLSSYNQSLELLTSQSESSELFYLGYFSLS